MIGCKFKQICGTGDIRGVKLHHSNEICIFTCNFLKDAVILHLFQTINSTF